MERIQLASVADRAEEVLAPPIAAVGFALLLCEVVGSNRGPVLRVYIERPDGEPVDIANCVTVNDAVTDVLDTVELFSGAYSLEVSSAGLERPLKRVEHFQAQIGKLIKFRTWEPVEGRRNWKTPLVGIENDLLIVQWDERQVRVPLAAVERANLVYVAPPRGEKKGGGQRRQKKSKKRSASKR